jgi:excisionase family DNA binding protein
MIAARELLTRKDVAELFQVTTMTVFRLEQDGKLPAIRLGAGTVRYRRSDVEKFIAASLATRP